MIRIRSVFSPRRKKGWLVGGIKKCWVEGGSGGGGRMADFPGKYFGSASDQKDTSPIVGLDMMDIILLLCCYYILFYVWATQKEVRS